MSGLARALGLLLATFAAGCAGSQAAPPPAEPEPGWASGAPPARCGDGSPIRIRAADVAIVIDASRSTREPGGSDVDQDGLLGAHRHSHYTDPDDSIFEAQLAAAQRLVQIARLDGMRFSIVTLTGFKDYPYEDSHSKRVDARDGRLEVPLTDDVVALESALTRIGGRGPDGASSFAPAMKLALRSLKSESDGSYATKPRRVLFLSDSWTPVRHAPSRAIARTDPRMKIEAQRAIDAGVRFDTFAIGPAAAAAPPHALEQIAGATGGTYRVVADPDPNTLYCALLASLQVVETTKGPRRFVEERKPVAPAPAEPIGEALPAAPVSR